MLTFFCYTDGTEVTCAPEFDPVQHPLEGDHLHWLDLEDPSPEEVLLLRDIFQFHPLAIEDCLVETPHPKIDDYGAHLFIVMHGVNFTRQEFATTELEVFFSRRFIVTHHRAGLRSVETIRDRVQKNPRLMARGTSFLLHELLDTLVDLYAPALEQFEQRMAQVEDEVFQHPTRETLNQLFALKREILHLKRIIGPQREVIHLIARDEFALVDDQALPYFRDVYDHLYRIHDFADTYRDLLSGLLEGYLSMVSNRLNEVMKTLTVIATLILPLTLIAGIYGMNFEYIPELKWRWGYFGSLGLMALTAMGLLYYLKRRRWL